MGNVQFEENQKDSEFKPRIAVDQSTDPLFVRILIRTRFIKEEKEAIYVLIAIAAICLIAMIAILYMNFGYKHTLSPGDLRRPGETQNNAITSNGVMIQRR